MATETISIIPDARRVYENFKERGLRYDVPAIELHEIYETVAPVADVLHNLTIMLTCILDENYKPKDEALFRDFVNTLSDAQIRVCKRRNALNPSCQEPAQAARRVKAIERLLQEARFQEEQAIEEAAENEEDGENEADAGWCYNNDCERPSCHRCFPRKDCTAHEKCRDYAEKEW